MPLPPNAKAFSQPMDPADTVDFQVALSQGVDLNSFFAPGENAASYTLTLPAEAVAAGLQIVTAGGYATTLLANNLRFWLKVDSTMQGNAIFDGAGQTLGVVLTVTTTSTPVRVKQRTYLVQVANQ